MRAWYHEIYLKSDHWRDLRAEKLASRGRACERCGCRNELQIHHNAYRSIFDVGLDDLEVLCRPCHKTEHQRLDQAYRVEIVRTSPKHSPAGQGKRRLQRERSKARAAEMSLKRGGTVNPFKAMGVIVALIKGQPLPDYHIPILAPKPEIKPKTKKKKGRHLTKSARAKARTQGKKR